jgi:hypothetical protein
MQPRFSKVVAYLSERHTTYVIIVANVPVLAGPEQHIMANGLVSVELRSINLPDV